MSNTNQELDELEEGSYEYEHELKLWRFSEYGGYGDIEGLFIATRKEIDDYLVGTTVYFGEVLGKYSEVEFEFSKNSFQQLIVSKETVLELLEAVKDRRISGYNPFTYLEEKAACNNCCYYGNPFVDWIFTAEGSKCPQCGDTDYTIY